MKNKKKNNNQPKICYEQKLNFEDCEQAIMREAVEEIDDFQKKNKIINGPEIQKIMSIVEDFIRSKKLILYGGQAINSILPKNAQFYNEGDIPDYDFFTTNSPKDAKELADIFYKAGYTDVEAKSGVHKGTQKIFVSNIPAADLTQQDPIIFSQLLKNSIIIDGIHYAPANWLRMGMYLELCRTYGDTTRFSKVLKRLSLLNTFYPLKTPKNCQEIEFQREFGELKEEEGKKIYDIVLKTFINQDVVFFGGYALSLYSQYMPHHEKKIIKKISDFDVLSNNSEKTARIIIEQLNQNGYKKARYIEYKSIGEIIPKHIEIRIENETIAFIYEPQECVNYNLFNINKETNLSIRIATIDTILRFYLAFIYTNRPYYDIDRLICMAKFLFRVQQENRLTQKGLLKRFTTMCIGEQQTLEDIRAEKNAEFKRLNKNYKDPDYEQWFLKYVPNNNKKISTPELIKKTSSKTPELIKKTLTKITTKPPIKKQKNKKTQKIKKQKKNITKSFLFN